MPRAASSSSASLPAVPQASLLHPRGGYSSSARCVFVPPASVSSSSVLPRDFVLHRGKPNVPFVVSFCFHFACVVLGSRDEVDLQWQ